MVGGGFAGFWAAVAARRVSPDLAITVVNASDDLVVRPRLYEAVSDELVVALRPLLELVDVDLVVNTCTGLNGRTITLASGAALDFDALVVATGSVMARPDVAGMDHTHSIDTFADAKRFDAALRAHAVDADLTVVVVGAGFTGIELALELPLRLAAIGRPHRHHRVVLVDAAPIVGASLGPGPRELIEQALDQAGVELVLGRAVALCDEGGVTLVDGTVVHGDVVVVCSGLVAAPFPMPPATPRDHLGRVIVDEYLATTEPHVFVAGDAAVADTGSGQPTMLSCQHALLMGKVAGENAARCLVGLPLVPYVQERYVTCLDLGAAGAVLTTGWDRTVVRSGDAAKDVKRMINTKVIYPDPSDGRAGLLRQSELPSQ